MKKSILSLMLLTLMMSCAGASPAMARSYSSGRSSYTSRSYSAPRPAYRPAPTYVQHTTVVHNNSGGGSGGGGLLTGLVLGHMMGQPAQAAPIIVQQPAPQQVYENAQPIPAPVVQPSVQAPVQEESSHWGIPLFFLGVVGGGLYLYHKRTKETANG